MLEWVDSLMNSAMTYGVGACIIVMLLGAVVALIPKNGKRGSIGFAVAILVFVAVMALVWFGMEPLLRVIFHK